jgi:uncharacterized membrane protein YdbT with pleckstrin-like domain
MSYVNRVLQEGEVIRAEARVHWIIFLPGVMLAIIAIAIGVVASQMASSNWQLAVYAVAALIGLAALLQILSAWLRRWSTEMAVTDRRVIYKSGIVRRHTKEMHIDKVESVDVNQSILGRLLDYGEVIFIGTGSGWEPLRTIAAPLAFRSHVTGL